MKGKERFDVIVGIVKEAGQPGLEMKIRDKHGPVAQVTFTVAEAIELRRLIGLALDTEWSTYRELGDV